MRQAGFALKRHISTLLEIIKLSRWILVFRVRKPLQFLKYYFLIKRSLLFDLSYYLKRNPDLPQKGMNLLAHYVALGGMEGHDPNSLFDTQYYRGKYSQALSPEDHPLVHYITQGAAAGFNPHPLFDTAYYLSSYPNIAEEGINPLSHYLQYGAKDGRNPHPLFDTAYYLSSYPDVAEEGINPLSHYLQYGAKDGRNPHPLFDTAYYLSSYPDVAEAGINPLSHYLQYGVKDGRNPHPLFDTAYYLLRVPELKTTGVNPVIHFLSEGANRGIKPHPLFYPTFYLEKYPDIAASGSNPLVHFVENGSREGCDPNPMFDALYYLRQNPDVAASGQNVLVHYLVSGTREGRDPHPFFHTIYYAKMNYDVIDAGFNPLAHYVEYGLNEGRLPYNLYDTWVQSKRLTAQDLETIKTQIDQMAYYPVFSVIVPVYNTDERWLRRCLESVLSQLYPHWELCIADDASTEPHVREVLAEYAARDPRIRVVYQKENGHISAASNAALALAQGEFIALLDHDDEISIDALYENAALLNAHPDADMIYSDEDKITEEGIRHMPFFKPDWSPDTFLSQMYSGHLGVYRTEMIRKIGGFRIGFEGSQDYDLVLRFTEQTSSCLPHSQNSLSLAHHPGIHGQDGRFQELRLYVGKQGHPGGPGPTGRGRQGRLCSRSPRTVPRPLSHPGQSLRIDHHPDAGQRPFLGKMSRIDLREDDVSVF